MIIANLNSGCAINFSSVPLLYISEKGTIRTEGNARSFNLCDYGSFEVAKVALKIILQEIQEGKLVVFVPDKDKIERETRMQQTVHRATNGKKTVRRGGS